MPSQVRSARRRATVDLLLMALGRADLIAPDDRVAAFDEGQRKAQWSLWLAMALRSLDQHLPADENVLTV